MTQETCTCPAAPRTGAGRSRTNACFGSGLHILWEDLDVFGLCRATSMPGSSIRKNQESQGKGLASHGEIRGKPTSAPQASLKCGRTWGNFEIDHALGSRRLQGSRVRRRIERNPLPRDKTHVPSSTVGSRVVRGCGSRLLAGDVTLEPLGAKLKPRTRRRTSRSSTAGTRPGPAHADSTVSGIRVQF